MGNKKYTFYVDDKFKPIQEVLDKICEERRLSQTMLRLLTNGLLNEAEEMTKRAKEKAKEMEKTEKLYRKLKEQKTLEEEQIFSEFKKHRQGADKHENVAWLKKRAERINKDPVKLLEDFEHRLAKGGEEESGI